MRISNDPVTNYSIFCLFKNKAIFYIYIFKAYPEFNNIINVVIFIICQTLRSDHNCQVLFSILEAPRSLLIVLENEMISLFDYLPVIADPLMPKLSSKMSDPHYCLLDCCFIFLFWMYTLMDFFFLNLCKSFYLFIALNHLNIILWVHWPGPGFVDYFINLGNPSLPRIMKLLEGSLTVLLYSEGPGFFD